MPLEHRVLRAGDKVYRRRLSLAEPGEAKNETADDDGRVNQLIICSVQQTFADLLQRLG